jgi:hypothetical protein
MSEGQRLKRDAKNIAPVKNRNTKPRATMAHQPEAIRVSIEAPREWG